MSKISIIALVVGLMFLGALFFAIGFLSALTSLETAERSSQGSWQAASAFSQQQLPPPLASKTAPGFAGFLNSYVDSQAQQQLSGFERQGARAALMVPKPLQPFARYGAGEASPQVQGQANQGNPFLNRKNARMMAPPSSQPYASPPPPVRYGQMQQQPLSQQPQYQQPMPSSSPPLPQYQPPQYQPPQYQQQGPQSQYRQQPPRPMMPQYPSQYPSQYPQPQAMPQQQGYYR